MNIEAGCWFSEITQCWEGMINRGKVIIIESTIGPWLNEEGLSILCDSCNGQFLVGEWYLGGQRRGFQRSQRGSWSISNCG